MIVFYMI